MTAPVDEERAESLPQEHKAPNHKRRNRWLLTLVVIFLLAGLVWFLYWIFIGRFYVYTEDSYVHGNQVMLTPQVSAGVAAIYAEDTDLVEQGQLVVELDQSDHLIAFEEAQERLAQTVRDVVALFQDVGAKEAEVILREARLKQAELDLKHRQPLVETGAVSVEEYEIYRTDVQVAASSLELAEKELEMAKARVEGTTVRTHPLVQEQVWVLRQSYLNLIRCRVWAPVTGFVAKRSVQVGDQVKEGDTLLFIVPLDDIWIEANYKETHLRNVRIGQPVEYTADIYGGGVKFHGKVVGFQPGSGNAFALLPPENASGNWIKIVQRVPVRISVDPEEIRCHPLFLGLSMRTHIDVHDTSGKMLAETPTMRPIYSTTIYSKQMEEMAEVDPVIEEIIKQNSQLEEDE
ncbi:MAG: efflux RND transporter periplasmic adaptor subunit [Chlamydiales bacterium]|nr:efflux RND transporter periplasmic adaptor subunit [Chlamydiales bacterium]